MNAPKGLYWKQSFFESFNPPKAPEPTKSVPEHTDTETGMRILNLESFTRRGVGWGVDGITLFASSEGSKLV